MTEPLRGYRFHPLERRGLVVGLGVGQVAVLAGGALAALTVLRSIGGEGGAAGAVAVVALAAVLGCWPLAGRSPVAWLPIAARWVVLRVHGPVLAGPGRAAAPAGVRLIDAPCGPGDEPLGVVCDARNGTWAAVLPVAGRPFTLLDGADKQRRLAAWGAVLASMARTGNPVHRVQWVERTVPSDPSTLARPAPVPFPPAGREAEVAEGAGWAAREEGQAGMGVAAAVDSYLDLVGGSGVAAVTHEVLLVVAVRLRRTGRERRPFGRGPEATCALLRRELRLLRGQLRNAELEPGAALDLPALAAAVRTGVDPAVRAGRRPPTAALGGGCRSPGSGDSAWPVGWDDRWAATRLDGRWHATYWIAEWPRREVGPDFLAPLLLAGVARAVSVTMAPVPPDQAVREVESAKTAELADAELRRRAGFVPTARHRRQAEGVAEREAELADGHGVLRFSGFVSVSGADPAELEAACAAVETAAHQAGLLLRRLYGQQAEAFTWTLPLGRGLQ